MKVGDFEDIGEVNFELLDIDVSLDEYDSLESMELFGCMFFFCEEYWDEGVGFVVEIVCEFLLLNIFLIWIGGR